jgi:hypothetical protein
VNMDGADEQCVRVSVRVWEKLVLQSQEECCRRADVERKAQFDLCRELLASRDISDIGWVCFRKTLTADDRRRLFLVGFDSLQFLEDEFNGATADLEREARETLAKKRSEQKRVAMALSEAAYQEKLERDLREAIEDQA